MSKLLELVDVVTNFYTYEGVVKALNKVSLSLEYGSTFGLVGESGCGKSVTARSIMRIIQPPGLIESGRILFHTDKNREENAVDLLRQSDAYMEDLRGNQISMIFQEPNSALNPIMTIGDQVAESFLFHQKKEMSRRILADLHARTSGILAPVTAVLKVIYRIHLENPHSIVLKFLNRLPVIKHWDKRLRREALRRSVDILKKLGVPLPVEIVKNYPHNVSGGIKQRIVIAIALACHPLLLIADEATSNLDVTIQAQILELLKDLKKKEISSILFITHDLGVVAETCDRVGVMYAGNLCEVAEVEDIFENPKHPYTVALLNSVPKISQEGELRSIKGNVPSLVSPPSGCRFHPRCGRVLDICKRERPESIEIGKDHFVSCHVYSQSP